LILANSAGAQLEQAAPVKTDVAYALVTLGSSTTWAVWNGWLMYFYLAPAGTPRVPIALYSIAVLSTGAVNALLTPPIGYLSDYTRSRWGRRLPYMFASALPMLVFFVLLWTPPVTGESTWNLVYLVIVLGLYNAAYCLNQVPYAALLPELALTDQRRIRMSFWTTIFMLLGMVLSSFVGPLIGYLENTLRLAGNVTYVAVAGMYALVLLPVFYLPFLALRERPGRQIAAAERLNFRQSISFTLRNPAFQVLTATGVLYWSVTSFVQAVVPFVVTEICLMDKANTMYFYLLGVLVSLACYPLITRLSARFGKWRVAAGSLLAGAAILPGLMLIGPWLPLPLPVQGLVWIGLEAIALSGVVILTPAFTAEITDYDETLTGQRREGAYYSAWGLLDEVINGVALTLLPLVLLLGRSHSDPHGPLGVRMVGVLGGLMLFAAFLIFLRYPLRQQAAKPQQAVSASA
jgi:GPH family glycoside/pentoside/hexuronide:cation symporter